jgi:hypothetical protein
MNEVDYSLTKMVRSKDGGKINEKDLVFEKIVLIGYRLFTVVSTYRL